MKHLKTFEKFVYENEVNETLYEASFSGRAWAGKIENIDKLLAWMYDKGILNKGEQAEKDRKFREYYRWYNDGDRPRGMTGKDEDIERQLENSVEEFIKKILAKYAGKYDRKDFRLDTLLGDLHTLKSIVDGEDAYGLLNHWGKKINVNDSEFEKLLGDLRPIYDKAKEAVNKAIADAEIYKNEKPYNIPGPSTGISYQKKRMEEDGIWTPALQKEYDNMTDVMVKMSEILTNVIEATERLKSEIGV